MSHTLTKGEYYKYLYVVHKMINTFEITSTTAITRANTTGNDGWDTGSQ
jgi:hypothetical protein